jgi:hypothetical protein
MSDDWMNDPNLLAAAFEGMAGNSQRGLKERLQLAEQANVHLHEALERAKLERDNVLAAIEDLKRANDSLWPVVIAAEDLKAGFDARKPSGGDALPALLYQVEQWLKQSKKLYPASARAHRMKLMEDVLDAAQRWLNDSKNLSAHFHGCMVGTEAVLADTIASYQVAEGDGFDPRA